MKHTFLLIITALLTLPAWSEIEGSPWEAVCTTDTDIVFSIKAPEPLSETDNKTEFWMRIWRPDKSVQDYQLQMWKDKSVQILKSPKGDSPMNRQAIAEGSPMEKIYLRIFDREAFEKWDDQLEHMGPRGEELYSPTEGKPSAAPTETKPTSSPTTEKK